MYKAVIFDLDGTLLDTLEDLANACNYALDKCGFPIHQVEKYRGFVGDGRYKLIERILPVNSKIPEIFNKVLGLYDEYYEKHMMDMTKPYDGIINLLDSLNEKGLKLAVVSNKPHEFTTEVVKIIFEDKLRLVYGHRVDFPTKPNPATVFEVLKNFNVTKEECIYVGDSNVDIITAKNAGIKSIGVAWGFRGKEELEAEGADFIVFTAEELEKLILS
ncbi:MAG: HAD family hydrolase [Clostridiaceae bacterium]|nr:HAD family hydrolase [Clostridiaceae bacterium]